MGLQSLAANRDLSFKEIDTYISQQNLFAGMSSQEREGFVNSLKDAFSMGAGLKATQQIGEILENFDTSEIARDTGNLRRAHVLLQDKIQRVMAENLKELRAQRNFDRMEQYSGFQGNTQLSPFAGNTQ